MTSRRVIRTLDEIADVRSCPTRIRVDNGPENIAGPMLQWSVDHNVHLHCIDPGKPAQNAWIESFNGRVRDEFLNMQLFRTLPEIRAAAGSCSSTTMKYVRTRLSNISRQRSSSKLWQFHQSRQSNNRQWIKKWAQARLRSRSPVPIAAILLAATISACNPGEMPLAARCAVSSGGALVAKVDNHTRVATSRISLVAEAYYADNRVASGDLQYDTAVVVRPLATATYIVSHHFSGVVVPARARRIECVVSGAVFSNGEQWTAPAPWPWP